MRGKLTDFYGMQIGGRLVLERCGSSLRNAMWLCRCLSCGLESPVFAIELAKAKKTGKKLVCLPCTQKRNAVKQWGTLGPAGQQRSLEWIRIGRAFGKRYRGTDPVARRLAEEAAETRVHYLTEEDSWEARARWVAARKALRRHLGPAGVERCAKP